MRPIEPFHDSPDPRLYVPREATEQALDTALRCVAAPGRPVALLAPPGTGKTLLLHVLASRLPASLRSVYVPHPRLSVDELCAWTLGQLDSPRWPDSATVVRAYAAHRAACGGALVWLIDDADRLPIATAAWLAESAAVADGGMRLVLAAEAGPGTEGRPALSAFRALTRIETLAAPLSEPEVHRYVRSRLERTGADATLVRRCEAAVAAIAEASGGVPRAVNAACERLLGRDARPRAGGGG